MKIYLNQIPETGLSAKEALSPAPYQLDTEEIKVVSPLEVQYRVFLEEENLHMHFSLDCKMQCVCSRCLNAYESPLHTEGELAQSIGRARFIDVTDDLRQEILLEYPVKPLCQDTCKGICSVCGQNLNEATCHHT